MTSQELVEHVASHAGVPLPRAEIAVRVVLSTFGGYLSEARRQQLAEELPASVRGAVLSPLDVSVPIEERLLAPREAVARGRELIASVCHVLAEELSNDALEWLRAAIPPGLARMLAAPADETAPTMLPRTKPGSQHAISDVAADRTQSGSVAVSNPHGATKLSSSPGTTQERDHETLAEARGNRGRTLSTAKR